MESKALWLFHPFFCLVSIFSIRSHYTVTNNSGQSLLLMWKPSGRIHLPPSKLINRASWPSSVLLWAHRNRWKMGWVDGKTPFSDRNYLFVKLETLGVTLLYWEDEILLNAQWGHGINECTVTTRVSVKQGEGIITELWKMLQTHKLFTQWMSTIPLQLFLLLELSFMPFLWKTLLFVTEFLQNMSITKHIAAIRRPV